MKKIFFESEKGIEGDFEDVILLIPSEVLLKRYPLQNEALCGGFKRSGRQILVLQGDSHIITWGFAKTRAGSGLSIRGVGPHEPKKNEVLYLERRRVSSGRGLKAFACIVSKGKKVTVPCPDRGSTSGRSLCPTCGTALVPTGETHKREDGHVTRWHVHPDLGETQKYESDLTSSERRSLQGE